MVRVRAPSLRLARARFAHRALETLPVRLYSRAGPATICNRCRLSPHKLGGTNQVAPGVSVLSGSSRYLGSQQSDGAIRARNQCD
jgi:hypothetical protein